MRIKRIINQVLRSNNIINFNLLGYYFKRTIPLLYYFFVKSKSPKKIVFFIGNQGDGLSFVTRIIRRNKSVISISGDSNYWNGPDEMATVMEPVLPYSLRNPGLITKERIKSELKAPRSWSYGSNNFFHHYKSDESFFTEKIKTKFIRAISTSLVRFGTNKIFVDKSQVYSLKMRLINHIFKDKVYFVHITRDPYVSCFRAASGKAGDLNRFKTQIGYKKCLKLAVEHWNNVGKEIFESSTLVENYLKIKIEDILLEPNKKINQICEFIELDFDLDMMPAKDQDFPRYSKYSDRWYPIKSDLNSKYFSKIDEYSKEYIKNNIDKKLIKIQDYKI
ncbi:sulfotransferase [Flavobacteriaceae bacterium]|nr:sulfotransferase [Flavobacteriaceae bacterium]|tara:strand:- start:611 stop:1612 length:1002 start_codon:yes stop_codon:yes gene_type:complete